MAVDKLVDSAKLNAALNYEANKIIAKGGGTAPLAFDFTNEKGFGDYIDAIPSGGGGGSHNLPSGYTELEYIEATGTQYINTGYVPTNDTEIVCTFQRTAGQTYNVCEFGVMPTPKIVFAGIYTNWGSAGDKTGAYNPDYVFGPTTIRVNNRGVYNLLDALAVNFGSPTWTSGSLPMYVLARNNGGTVQRMAKEKLYYFCASENGVKQIELVPAIRRSDSEIGCYDTVSGTFFTNAGSGTFTGGAYT